MAIALNALGQIALPVDDVERAVKELQAKGVQFMGAPHLIAPMPDHDLWMAFFKDPAGNQLALMHEALKGYNPPP